MILRNEIGSNALLSIVVLAIGVQFLISGSRGAFSRNTQERPDGVENAEGGN